MTIQEKRTKLHGYCCEVSCDTCVLHGKWTNAFDGNDCIYIDTADEKELDWGLELIGALVPDDPVNHPSHYTKGKIEVADFIADQKLNFDRGNAVKYVCRAGSKDPNKEVQDLEKAIWYIEHEIKMLKGETEDGNSD